MNTLLIMDLVILGLCVYLFYICVSMKRTGKIHSILLTDAEVKKCKKQAEYVGYVTPRLFLFDVILFLDGLFGIACETWIDNRYFNFVYMLIFFAAFLWFTYCLKKAREMFC